LFCPKENLFNSKKNNFSNYFLGWQSSIYELNYFCKESADKIPECTPSYDGNFFYNFLKNDLVHDEFLNGWKDCQKNLFDFHSIKNNDVVDDQNIL
jgi:hypothetical protein